MSRVGEPGCSLLLQHRHRETRGPVLGGSKTFTPSPLNTTPLPTDAQHPRRSPALPGAQGRDTGAQQHYSTHQTLNQPRGALCHPCHPNGAEQGSLCPLPAVLGSQAHACSLLPLILRILKPSCFWIFGFCYWDDAGRELWGRSWLLSLAGASSPGSHQHPWVLQDQSSADPHVPFLNPPHSLLPKTLHMGGNEPLGHWAWREEGPYIPVLLLPPHSPGFLVVGGRMGPGGAPPISTPAFPCYEWSVPPFLRAGLRRLSSAATVPAWLGTKLRSRPCPRCSHPTAPAPGVNLHVHVRVLPPCRAEQ